MNDKELLMMAAKAAGVECDEVGPFIESKEWQPEFGMSIAGSFEIVRRSWEPLSDDGDALRLAVKLDMTVNIQGKWVMVDCGDITKRDYDDNNTILATRRAIVRAAAEIGSKL